MDLNKFDKSMVSESEKRVFEENDDRDGKNKKRKEVCLSGFESDAKKSKKDDVYGGKSQLDSSHKVSVSNVLSDPDKCPRCSELESDQDCELLGVSKTVDHAGAVNLEAIDGVRDDVASKSKYAGKVGGSTSNLKHKFDFDLNEKLQDFESIDEACGSISKSKLKFDFDLNNEPDLESIEEVGGFDLEEEVSVVESTSKQSGVVFINLVSEDDDEDDENLEQNAVRMLSSRFDPSCTCKEAATSSSGAGPTTADDIELKPTIEEDKGKGVMRKSRHFYNIPPEEMDANWFLNTRIKVFWPLDERWHHGFVKEYHPEFMLHQIKYDNQKDEWVNLKEEKFQILLFPDEVPENIKRSRKHSRKVKNVIIKQETVLPADDDDLDSEPLAVWLARAKSVPKSSKLPKSVVYVRRKYLKRDEAASLIVTLRSSVWSMDDNGRLRLNAELVESIRFRFQIYLPLLPFKEVSFGTEDLSLLHNTLMLQQGLIVTVSPATTLEMLFVDSYEGIRFILFEGCMKRALAFIFTIVNAFIQPDEQWSGNVHVPVTSIRFKLSCVEDVRKYSVYEFHCFSRMLSSKWLHVDAKLLRRCLLVKQLPLAACTHDNINELSSYAGFETKFFRGILPMGISRDACNARNVHLSTAEAPRFVISFCGAPTLFLTPHLQSLMENTSSGVNMQCPSELSTPENLENGAQCAQLNRNLVAVSDIVNKDDHRRRSSKRVRSSSISTPRDILSPVWTSGPKRPRTHVQYTLRSSGYGKQIIKNQPYTRIRRASMKTSNEKNSCNANVLITDEDKGWRECGADIVLEASDRTEWELAVKFSGVTKYSYKVNHKFQGGTTNRYSHCKMWKGGEDWILEFPDRTQWTLFKEMHEECYVRNFHASSVKRIPIPGVTFVEETDGYDVHFVRPENYFRQVQTDVEMALDPSLVLYDMDTEDEEWVMGNERQGLSDDLFEKIIDVFEKASYVQHRDNFNDEEIDELVVRLGSPEAAKLVYGYWRGKREKMNVPLMRHLQPSPWERYQQQLKEWERTVARGNSVSKHKKFRPEKPPMFAFCLKPRGLEIPNKSSKRRSHRKFSINEHHRSNLGRRSNRRTNVNEKVLYTNTVHESSDASPSLQASRRSHTHFTLGKPVFYRNKPRKVSSNPSSQNRRKTTVNTPNQNIHDGPHMQGAVVQLSDSALQELRAREASRVADCACKIAKLKRERAEKLLLQADLAIQRAATALMTADAFKAAQNCNKNDSDELSRP